MSQRSARDALLKAKWGDDQLSDIMITVRDRLTPSGRADFKGSLIERLGRSYIELEEARIPYHRIIELRRGEAMVWNRSGRVDRQVEYHHV